MDFFALIVIFEKYYTEIIFLKNFVPTLVPDLKQSHRQHHSVTRTHCLTYTQIQLRQSHTVTHKDTDT